MWKTRIAAPDQAKVGESIEIRTLIAHPMESGFRLDSVGQPIPRDIITSVVCTYAGREVFRAQLQPAIAANPYLSFFVTATVTGTLQLTWTDQHGQQAHAEHQLQVTK